jgi:hypothetical protein
MGEESNEAPVVELLDEGVEFLPWRGEGLHLNDCAVFADDEVWGED